MVFATMNEPQTLHPATAVRSNLQAEVYLYYRPSGAVEGKRAKVIKPIHENEISEMERVLNITPLHRRNSYRVIAVKTEETEGYTVGFAIL